MRRKPGTSTHLHNFSVSKFELRIIFYAKRLESSRIRLPGSQKSYGGCVQIHDSWQCYLWHWLVAELLGSLGLFSLSSFPLTLSQTHSPHHNSSLMSFCCNPHKSQYPDTSVAYWHRTSIYPVRPCWQVAFSLPVSLTFFFVYLNVPVFLSVAQCRYSPDSVARTSLCAILESSCW